MLRGHGLRPRDAVVHCGAVRDSSETPSPKSSVALQCATFSRKEDLPWTEYLTGRSILIVEDEPLIAIDIANAFTQAGARVLTVGHCVTRSRLWRMVPCRPPYLIMRWATVTVLSFARGSKSETSRSSCIADIANLTELAATACRWVSRQARKSS